MLKFIVVQQYSNVTELLMNTKFDFLGSIVVEIHLIPEVATVVQFVRNILDSEIQFIVQNEPRTKKYSVYLVVNI